MLSLGLFFLFVSSIHRVKAEDFCFITLADWHGAEGYVKNPTIEDSKNAPEHIETIKHIKQNYGGDLVMLPGDSNGGHWYEPQYPEFFNTTPENAVIQAGKNSYETMQTVFEKGGYSTLLMAVGDHEIGGNSWPAAKLKTRLLPEFREAFQNGFNTNPVTGDFLFPKKFGDVESRPPTPFDGTSFAYRHKNVLFITVDAFKTVEPDTDNFFDKAKGLGGEGTVTCTVEGEHLDWFESVLIEARKDPTIKHILVQAHLPILQPVRKVNCSGQFMDYAEQSEFWKMMRKYSVDIYFAGEVHANTATKDPESNLVQLVSRGNGFNNFLKVCVTDSTIDITSFNEVGVKPKYNRNYEYYGHLTVDKSNEITKFDTSGSLKFFNRQIAVIRLNFEQKVLLSSRPVPVLKHDDYRKTLIQKKITIRGIECAESFYNHGSYEVLYDAQVGNVALKPGVRGMAAELNGESRVAIWGIGPHTGGHMVSYALYFKTKEESANMILVHFGNIFGHLSFQKNIFTLALKRGRPVLYANPGQQLISFENLNLANGDWQHIAVSMPRKSCLLSEVRMYVNGNEIQTNVNGSDRNLFFHTAGRISLGGFGHSHNSFESVLEELQPFQGLIDEFYVFARRLYRGDLNRVMEKENFLKVYYKKECGGDLLPFQIINDIVAWLCKKRCMGNANCLGYEYTGDNGGECRLFQDRPSVGRFQSTKQCGIAKIT